MRSDVLALIAVVAGGAGATAAIAVASPARPASAVAGAARVQGRFAAAGRVTAAEHLAGVRRGERLRRVWTVRGEGCSASSCQTLKLEARLAIPTGAVDTLTLRRVSAGRYRFVRTVTSDALCRTRHINGTHRAAFALNLAVSRRTEVNGVWYATALSATWSAALHGCGVPAVRSAVTYVATVTSGVPAAALGTGSTTTSSAAPTTTTGTATTTTFPSSTGTAPTVTTISSTPSPTVPTTTTVPHGPQPQTGIS